MQRSLAAVGYICLHCFDSYNAANYVRYVRGAALLVVDCAGALPSRPSFIVGCQLWPSTSWGHAHGSSRCALVPDTSAVARTESGKCRGSRCGSVDTRTLPQQCLASNVKARFDKVPPAWGACYQGPNLMPVIRSAGRACYGTHYTVWHARPAKC